MKTLSSILAIAWLLIVFKPEAQAVPSYSRQTGLPCATCHFAPPELTPFGRKFKLDGYVFTTKAEVTDEKKDHNAALHLLEAFPLSVVFDTSYTATKSPQPATQNGNFQLPQDVSLFLAGAWGSHVGSFVQVTYTVKDNHFGWDNTDVRYANKEHELFGKSFTWGVTFNNNPTVEDLWNSTPAWGFPFTSSNVSPTPAAKAIINGALATDVAGIGGYAMWNEHFYFAGTVYRSQHLGGPEPNPGLLFPFNIRGFAPYWRLAWETSTKNNNLEIGTYGIHTKTSPNHNSKTTFCHFAAPIFARTHPSGLPSLRAERHSQATISTLCKVTPNTITARNFPGRLACFTSLERLTRCFFRLLPFLAARPEIPIVTATF